MATTAKPASISTANAPTLDTSHVSEVLEVADSILRRHQDAELAQKMFVMRGYLEMSRMYPERDYNEALHKALADLTAVVHLHLNAELQAIANLFGGLS
jgi:hypothetical protein